MQGPNILPVEGMIPGDMRPGTEWGIMWGFSGDVTLWVLLGGLPGLELKQKKNEDGGEEVNTTEEEEKGGKESRERLVLTFGPLYNEIPFQS